MGGEESTTLRGRERQEIVPLRLREGRGLACLADILGGHIGSENLVTRIYSLTRFVNRRGHPHEDEGDLKFVWRRKGGWSIAENDGQVCWSGPHRREQGVKDVLMGAGERPEHPHARGRGGWNGEKSSFDQQLPGKSSTSGSEN
jgi:hypothetical protein